MQPGKVQSAEHLAGRAGGCTLPQSNSSQSMVHKTRRAGWENMQEVLKHFLPNLHKERGLCDFGQSSSLHNFRRHRPWKEAGCKKVHFFVKHLSPNRQARPAPTDETLSAESVSSSELSLDEDGGSHPTGCVNRHADVAHDIPLRQANTVLSSEQMQ